MQLPKRKPGKYANQPLDPFLTQQKFDELSAKLNTLIKHSRPKWATEVSRLAELGDFSENVEYQLAKGKLRGINSAILKIQYQIDHAQIITPPKGTHAKIRIGSTVTISSEGNEKIYQILGRSETNPDKGIISHTSPIGAALLSHKVGDSVELTLPNKTISCTIIRVE
ncbi:MAG: transcription elongation factor GreA [Candidatus Magasanikbacteria bacterium]|jgi:transcription elongation factor GreA|nr:transcription elongation factor GreA [Candidatus Magasanikbacteria bacterium]